MISNWKFKLEDKKNFKTVVIRKTYIVLLKNTYSGKSQKFNTFETSDLIKNTLTG